MSQHCLDQGRIHIYIARVAELGGGQIGGKDLHQGASIYARPKGWTPYRQGVRGNTRPPETVHFRWPLVASEHSNDVNLSQKIFVITPLESMYTTGSFLDSLPLKFLIISK